MDRKIVEMFIGGSTLEAIVLALKVGKKRARRLREQAREHGYGRQAGRCLNA